MSLTGGQIPIGLIKDTYIRNHWIWIYSNIPYMTALVTVLRPYYHWQFIGYRRASNCDLTRNDGGWSRSSRQSVPRKESSISSVYNPPLLTGAPNPGSSLGHEPAWTQLRCGNYEKSYIGSDQKEKWSEFIQLSVKLLKPYRRVRRWQTREKGKEKNLKTNLPYLR